jgi:hypothetical protein
LAIALLLDGTEHLTPFFHALSIKVRRAFDPFLITEDRIPSGSADQAASRYVKIALKP